MILMVTILRDGTVGDVRVTRGNPMLAKAAVAAVRRWRFKPAVYQGRPIAVIMPIVVEFKLH